MRSAANKSTGGDEEICYPTRTISSLECYVCAKLMNHIPLAALSVILILIGYKLAKPAIIKEIYRHNNEQFLPYLITVVVIVLTDLLTGISAGMVTAIFLF